MSVYDFAVKVRALEYIKIKVKLTGNITFVYFGRHLFLPSEWGEGKGGAVCSKMLMSKLNRTSQAFCEAPE